MIQSDFPTRQPAPKIGENGTWLEWDELTQAYVDTGRPSRGDSAGLSDDIKTALLTIAEKAGYSDTHGQDYYDALYAALYPPAELLSITASFSQGSHVVYDTDTLESLKPYLTVTGAYDDGTSRTITSYTLSGTLTAGTSTITVTASGKTATFTVSVTHKVAQVTGISAVFTQGSVVIYDNASLDDLKPYLVVTASYDDGTSAAVSGYTLSGTLAAGTSTITASYSGFTDTFTVAVTERPVTLVSISAVFTQGDNVVYDTDSLDTLKPYLVVTAHYDDNTDAAVNDYTLSGTLEEGTSTITVSYGGKTTTFTVMVVTKDLPTGYTRFDYLTKTNKQQDAINTGLYYNPSFAVLDLDFEFEVTGTTSDTNQQGMGLRETTATKTNNFAFFFGQGEYNITFRSQVLGSNSQIDIGEFVPNKIRHCSYRYNNGSPFFTVDGGERVSMPNPPSTIEANSTYPLWLCGLNNGHNNVAYCDSSFGRVRWGRVTFKDPNGNKVYDFVPASDGAKAGYYERVNGVFYPSIKNQISGGTY